MKLFIWESGSLPDQGVGLSSTSLYISPQIGNTAKYDFSTSFSSYLVTGIVSGFGYPSGTFPFNFGFMSEISPQF